MSMRFDAVILLDAESTPLAANLPAITRADQVIAVGDPHAVLPRVLTENGIEPLGDSAL